MAQADFIVKNGAVVLNGLTATSTSTTTGALVVHGGIATSDRSTFGGPLYITNTATSTSSLTGALVVTGGVGIQGDLIVQGVNLLQSDFHQFYVSEDGDDAQSGKLPQSAVRTLRRALELAVTVGANASVNILAGTYVEEFPLTVPAGVSVKGAGLRQVYVSPTTATNTQSAFLLNGETTISDFTVGGFYKPGYAFKFAPNAKITTRSPYVERFSVLTKGSNPTAGDPYGFDSNDAGGGAYLDGTNVDPTSIEAAFLFNEATFIVPSSEAVHITNGTRVELLNGFSYFADRGIVGTSGTTGWGGQGRTRLRLANSTGTFTVGHSLHYVGSTGTLLASGLIDEVTSEYVYLDGKASGFVEAADRTGKTVNVYGNTVISSFERKFGTGAGYFTTDGDLIDIVSDADMQYGFSSYTLEAWVNLTQNGRKQYLVNKGLTPSTTFGMWIGADNKLTGQHGTTAFTSTNTLSTGTWYHVMMSRDLSNTNRLFINGNLEVTTTSSASVSNADSLTIGGYTSVPSLSLRGYIDEIRVSTTARYTGAFTPPTGAYASDIGTTVLLHCDGANLSTSFTDDGLGSQNVYSTTGTYTAAVVASSQQISLADYRQFGGELRSIGSAVCYGNYGIYTDGEGIDFKAIAFNMSYIGAGKDLTNDPSLAVQANEIVRLNGAKVYFQTVDHLGDFRVGPEFRINQRTGNVDFGTANFRLGPLSSLTISDGVNTSVLQPTSIQVGQLLLSGSTVQTISGNLTLNPAGSLTTIESDLQVNGALNFTGQLLATSVANAVSTTTGALVVSGGVGIAKDLWVGGKATIVGDLVVRGTTTIVNSTQTSIVDPILDLGINPDGTDLTVDDGFDRGLLLHYNTGSSTSTYTRTFLGMDNNTETLIYKTGVITGPAASYIPSFANSGTWGAAKFGTLELMKTDSGGLLNTGALKVAGGGSFAGDLYANRYFDSTGLIVSTSTIGQYVVTQALAGVDISIDSSITNPGRGVVTINNTSTLQTVTQRGSTTTVVLTFANATNSTGTTTGALIVTGGVGVGGNLYASNLYSNGSPVVTESSIGDLGVTALTAGTDTAVSSSTGVIVIWNTSTLDTVTQRGSTTTAAITILNTASSTSTNSGALTVSGGVGVSGDLYAATIYSNGIQVLTTETDTLESVTMRGAITPYAVTFSNTSQATISGSTKAVGISGGLYVGRKLYVNEFVTFMSSPILGAIDSRSALTVNGTNQLQSWYDPEGGILDLSWTGTGVTGYFQLLPAGSQTLALGANDVVKIASGSPGTNFVGINTATATAQLEVGGDIKAANIYSNGSLVITNASLGTYGVTSLTTGSGIAVNTSTGAVIIESIDTLQLVTDRGNSTNNTIIISNNSASNSTSTGALVVEGGVGIGGQATIETALITGSLRGTPAATVVFENTTASTTTTDGAVVIYGGLGVGKQVYAAELYDDGRRVVTSVNPTAGPGITISDEIGVGTATSFTINNTGVIAAVGSTYIGVSSATGIVTFTNLGVQTLTAGTDTSVSRTTGTVVVWNTSTLQSITNRGSTTTNAISISNITNSNTSTAGALTVAGGVGIGRNLIVGGNAAIYGNLQVLGTQTYVNSTQTVVIDPVLGIGAGIDNSNLNVNDGFDRGLLLHYSTTATSSSTYDNHSFLGMDNTSKKLVYKTDIWPGGIQEFPALFANTGTWGAAQFGSLNLVNTTSATNTVSGALTVSGGAGIGGDLYVGNKIFAAGLEVLTTSSLGSGGIGVSQIFAGTDTAVSSNFGAITIWSTATLDSITSRSSSTDQIIYFNNTSQATSTATGAVQVSGGVSIKKNLYVEGNIFGAPGYIQHSEYAGLSPGTNQWIKCLTWSLPNVGDSTTFKIKSAVKATASVTYSDNMDNDVLWISYVKDTVSTVLGTVYWLSESGESAVSVTTANHSITFNPISGNFEYWRRSVIAGGRIWTLITEEIPANVDYQCVTPTIVTNSAWAASVTSLGSVATIDDPDVNSFEDFTIGGTLTHSGTTSFISNSTAALTANIASGATIAAALKTVNIGAAGLATSIANVNIGSTITGALGVLTVASTLTNFRSTQTAINTQSAAVVIAGGLAVGDNIVVGDGAITRGILDANVIANGIFAAAGDAQSGLYILRGLATSTSTFTLTVNNTTATTNNQVILPDNSSYMFKVFVTAKSTTSNDEGAWEFNGSISRYAGANTTVVRTVNKTKIWSSQAYDVNIVADAVNGGLSVQAIGVASGSVRFVAKVETVEVTT